MITGIGKVIEIYQSLENKKGAFPNVFTDSNINRSIVLPEVDLP